MAMIHMEPQTLQLFERVLGTLKPPPNLTLSQWADKYRRLSAEASSAKGQWNTDNAPFQREIMDAIGDVHIRKVVAMMCAQAGKTEGLILNTVGFYMSYYPAPIMIVQPTVNLGESFSKDRLATMIRDTPILRGLVDNKSRYSGNTITKKNFPGGQLTIIGANSPTDLRGRPIKVLLADEVDAYKASAGKEGDPIMLAEERQTTYWDHKTVLVSTPTTKASSRILDEFNASTQEEWNIPCPNCGKYQPFVWDGMVFDKEKWPEGGVQYRCAECGCLDNEYRWKKNSTRGKWVAAHPERKVRGFHMNKMGSTLCGWNEIVEKFIAADLDASRGDYEKMQVFVNTNLGLPWEEPGETVETAALIDRREFYEAEVPDGVLYLTCGIDTQDNRFEAEVVGWGIGKESWGIRYQRIYGDLKRGQVWADLDDFLSTTWKKRDGTELSIRAACMDSGGHFPDQVIRFCKEREDRHIWAIKGRGGMDVPYIRNPTKNNRVGGELFVLGYLTCGIDTQDNRFEAEVVGWGIGKESWGIRYQRIYGDLKRGQVWADLDDFLSTTWKKRDGTELSIRAACMDSGGHFPDQVIRFCKEREDRHIWAIKGRGGMDVPYIRNPTKNNRVGGELFVLGVDTGKNAVLARLKVLIKGPNYCHFPAGQDAGYDENYFKMLTAEHKVTRWKGGRKVERWELKDPAQKRNEAFDIRNYATAALEISNPPGLEIPGEDAPRPAKPQHQYRRRRSGGI